jgi:spore coat protein U-like protein
MLAGCVLGSGLVPRPAAATTPSASFGVSVIVQSGCRVSASATHLGTYAAAMAETASTFTVTCTLPTPYNVDLRSGRAMDSTGITSKMAAPGPVAPGYALFWDSGRVADGAPVVGSHPSGWTGIRSAPDLPPLQGEGSTGRRAASGSVADTITVTVTY